MVWVKSSYKALMLTLRNPPRKPQEAIGIVTM